MDETLKRIISLFPVNEAGKPVRGSSKELADYLNLPHNIVAEWKSGRNKSYTRYLYEIAEKYNVSVEWLKGETDEKEQKNQPATEGDRLNPDYMKLNAANRAAIDAAIAALLKSQQSDG